MLRKIPKLDQRPASSLISFTREDESFSTVLTNQGTEAFALINNNKSIAERSDNEVDETTGVIRIKLEKSTIEIKSPDFVHSLSPEASKLFFAGLNKLQKINAFRAKRAEGSNIYTVKFSLKEYQDLRGVRDGKELKKSLKKAIDNMPNINTSWQETRKGEKQPENFGSMTICPYAELYKGFITLDFNTRYVDALLSTGFLLDIPNIYFKINSKKNPYSCQLCYTVAKFYAMNVNKKNENIIPITTLLHHCGIDPTKAVGKNRSVSQRIFEPLERDLDILNDVFTWEYCLKDGSPLTQKELEAPKTFETLNQWAIRVHWRQKSSRMISMSNNPMALN